MPGFLLWLALVSAVDASAQDCDSEPFTSALKAVAGGRQQALRLASCARIPGHPDAAVAVFAFVQPTSTDDFKTYDVEIVISNVRTARPDARLSLRGVWPSDAYKIDAVAVTADRYPLRPGARVFGLTESWSGSSRVSFYTTTRLGLFMQQGKAIVPVLSDLAVDIVQGENDCIAHTTRTLEVQPASATGHARIVVSEVIENTSGDNSACPPGPVAEPPETLPFRNGKYVVPDRLKP